jgi:shikimate dehydrogenase
MKITGTTRMFYCIADPIDQVRAPEVFNAVFARHEVDAVMVPMRVAATHLAATLRSLLASPTVGGISLSIPHKAAAAATVDRCSAAALAANAVNAVRRGATRRENWKESCSTAWDFFARWIAPAWLTLASASF